MLDQSFSAENFRKIFDIENRKGVYLEGEFYSDIAEINRTIKEANREIRILRSKSLPKEEFIIERENITGKKDSLRNEKEEKLNAKLEGISRKITAPNFSIELTIDNTITSKPVYKTAYEIENILALKQLQYNFRKLYKVKQSSRYSIISQLKCLLNDGFPKAVLKTDIKAFYESIPHDKLLKKINDDNLLTNLSMKFIQQVLKEFKRISASTTGVPRGIGISPYLAELYMRDIDKKIQSLPSVQYYARYVDDIIVIFMPETSSVTIDYINLISGILSEEGLAMNTAPEKTKLINLFDKNLPYSYTFEYLGYKFTSGYSAGRHIPLEVTISTRKRKRYAERITKAFELYTKHSKYNEKKARKILIKRLRFMTSNTRLVNNKRNVITGVYYTNSLVTTSADFKILDRFLSRLVKKSGIPQSLANRITPKFSFEAGFNPSNMSRFKISELNAMMNHWTK